MTQPRSTLDEQDAAADASRRQARDPQALTAAPSHDLQASPAAAHGQSDEEASSLLAAAVQALDAAYFPHRATFSIAGCPVGVRSNNADLLGSIARIWRPFKTAGQDGVPADRWYSLVDFGPREARSPLAQALIAGAGPALIPPGRRRFLVLSPEQHPNGSDRAEDVIDFLDWHGGTTSLTRLSTYAVYHGAVLSWRDGEDGDDGDDAQDQVQDVENGAAGWGFRGLLLPAASGSGKTTLTAALVRAGFGYLSDEAALVDSETLCVHAYPKLLSVKQPTVLARLLALPDEIVQTAPHEAGQVWHLDPELLAPGCRRAATRIGVVIFPRYEAGGQTRLEPLGRGSAALALLRCGVSTPTRPPGGVDLATALVAHARCYRLIINDLPSAVRLVTSLCSTGGAAAEPAP